MQEGIVLRPYQDECVRKILDQFELSQSTLAVLATGLGKTVIGWSAVESWLAKHPGRALWLAHREELISQAFRAASGLTSLHLEIEQADLHATGNLIFDGNSAVVGSMQSLVSGRRCRACAERVESDYYAWQLANPGMPEEEWPGAELGCEECDGGRMRRMARFNPDDFSIVVIDECHHAVSKEYRRIVRHFSQNPKCKILGVTATPDRSDEIGLNEVFGSVAYRYEILEGIRDGYLVPIKQASVCVEELDLSEFRQKKTGDFKDADMKKAFDRIREEAGLHKIAVPIIEQAGDRQTIVFVPDVATAEELAEILNRYKPGKAEFICGDRKITPKQHRKQILDAYARGELQYVVNCQVLTEGFDAPVTSCIAMARPTGSRALMAQCIGRGTRVLPGVIDGIDTAEGRRAAIAASPKPDLLVLDFWGNSGKHKLVGVADVLGGREAPEIVDLARRRVREQSPGKPVDMEEELELARQQVEEIKERERKRAADLTVRAKYKVQYVDPFDIFATGRVPSTFDDWERRKKATPRQREALRKLGLPDEVVRKMTIEEAAERLDILCERINMGLSSYKQCMLLKRYGVDGTDLTFHQAQKVIDAIAARRWRVPRGYVHSVVQRVKRDMRAPLARN